VAVAVPGNGAHAVAGLHAEHPQRLGHAPRTGREIAIGVAMDVALDAARHHLLVTVVTLGMRQQ